MPEFFKMYIFPFIIHTKYRRGTTLYTQCHHRLPQKETTVKGGTKVGQ